jgi:CSLREA domain-containing protein
MGKPGGRTLAAAGGCVLAAAQIFFAGQASARSAATVTFQVTTTADAHDADPGDGRCADAAGQCTLRAAIEEADASPAGTETTVSVPAGTYLLTLGTLAAGTGSAVSITIDGAGRRRSVISARGAFRLMSVAAAATVVLDGLAITDGNAGPNGYGGGVLNSGTLTLAGTAVAHNRAGAGGGVDNSGGSLVVTGSRIQDNSARYFGGGGVQNGGLQNLPGSVLVVSSTITGNRSGNEGGGIFSGQNGHPSSAGLAAVAPRALCSAARCAAQRAPTAAGLVLTVLDSNVSGNHGGNGGGGIAAEGIANVIGSVVDDNSAGGAVGGGAFDVSLIRRSTISGNQASSGGGVEAFPGLNMTITTSTLDGNHAAAYGGAIDESGLVKITRSTLAANTAGGRFLGSGAAVELQGGAELRLSDSTLAGNSTRPAGGGAIDNYGGLAELSFDTFAGNSGSLTGSSYSTATGTILATDGSEPDCQVPLHETAGYNLSTDTSCGLSRPTDLTGADPQLGPLAGHGGSTQTEALLRGSPAIDAGGLPATSGCPLLDQRGQSRPWGPACDIGAFELHYRLSPGRASSRS